MKTEIKLTIPKHKIAGLRMGQLIYNAIKQHAAGDDDIVDFLFNAENYQLQIWIDEFLEEYKKEF